MDNGIVFLAKMIKNNNRMYAEEGSNVAWNLLVFQTNVILQYMYWDGDTEVISYHIKDVNDFMDKLKVKYDEDGGDDEYKSITEWILNQSLVRKLAIRIE